MPWRSSSPASTASPNEERTTIEGIGKKGFVVVREQKRGVIGHGLMKPTEAAKAIEAQIPFKFTSGLFTKAWKKLSVRPPVGDPQPERTDDKYCFYDERHRDYGYTPAYVSKIVRETNTEAKFRKFLQTTPRDKETGNWVGEPPPGPPWAKKTTSPTDENGDGDVASGDECGADAAKD